MSEGEAKDDKKPAGDAPGQSAEEPTDEIDELIETAAEERSRAAEALERMRPPLEGVMRAAQLHERAFRGIQMHEDTMKKLARSFETSSRIADMFRGAVMPDFSATMGRLTDVVGASTGAAKVLDSIAAMPSREPSVPLPIGPRPEVAAMYDLQDEVRTLAKIASATATSTATLAEVAKASLEQTGATAATIARLHETTRLGIESNEKTAGVLVHLTWALLIVTVAIAILTAVLLFRAA